MSRAAGGLTHSLASVLIDSSFSWVVVLPMEVYSSLMLSSWAAAMASEVLVYSGVAEASPGEVWPSQVETHEGKECLAGIQF